MDKSKVIPTDKYQLVEYSMAKDPNISDIPQTFLPFMGKYATSNSKVFMVNRKGKFIFTCRFYYLTKSYKEERDIPTYFKYELGDVYLVEGMRGKSDLMPAKTHHKKISYICLSLVLQKITEPTFLWTETNNYSAISLYTKMGFLPLTSTIKMKEWIYNRLSYIKHDITFMSINETLELVHHYKGSFNLNCHAQYNINGYIPGGLFFSPTKALTSSSFTFQECANKEGFTRGDETYRIKIPLNMFCLLSEPSTKPTPPKASSRIGPYGKKIVIIRPEDLPSLLKYKYITKTKYYIFTIIEWSKLAKHYSGILFRPYERKKIKDVGVDKKGRKVTDDFLWYDSLDGETCVIWDLKILKECQT